MLVCEISSATVMAATGSMREFQNPAVLIPAALSFAQ